LLVATEHGLGLLLDDDLEWALRNMTVRGASMSEAALAEALKCPSDSATELSLRVGAIALPIRRLDFADVPHAMGFVRDPKP
jgi:hypothetical protein